MSGRWEIREGDALDQLREMPAESVHCCVTSPPYFGLRDYGVDGQIGLEANPDAFVAALVAVFREVRRVLRDDGTLWLNMGDSYASGGRDWYDSGDAVNGSARGHRSRPDTPPRCKPKDLLGVPWLLAFALRADGWYLRSDIIWAKPNPMPESVTDRPTSAHEHLFLLAKSPRYFYDADAIREPHTTPGAERNTGTVVQDDLERPKHKDDQRFRTRPGSRPPDYFGHSAGRNKRNVWEITTQPYAEAHFATSPPKLVEPCILAGCPEGGTILDPFAGAGTTGVVALRHGRSFVGIELNPVYAELARERIRNDAPLLNHAAEMAA